MNSDLTAYRDPRTGAPLRHDGDALIAEDGASFPIVDGIPRFVPKENYASDFGLQWKQFPQTQLDSHTGIPVTADRLGRCFHGELDQLTGKRVLEAGSGAGRFTEILLAHGADLFSFDYSAAIETNAINNGADPHLHLAQADIRHIPFAPRSFDYVVCLGVIQHTPSPEESIRSLWRMVAPGGRLVIDHYRYRLRFRLPTPVGDAASVYRWAILKLPQRLRYRAVKRITDFWFPVHWRFRQSITAQRVIRRLSPLRFYYPDLPLRDRTMHYEWSLLDTHDSTTDYFKHLRSPEQITALLEELGAVDIRVSIGGNGVEAFCIKPAVG